MTPFAAASTARLHAPDTHGQALSNIHASMALEVARALLAERGVAVDAAACV